MIRQLERIEKLESQVESHAKGLAAVEKAFKTVDVYTYKRLGEVTEEISAVEKAAIETDVNLANTLAELATETAQSVDGLIKGLSALNMADGELESKIDALEKQLGEITKLSNASYEETTLRIDSLTRQLSALTKTMSEAFEGTRRTAGILNGKVNMFGEAAKKADAIIEAKVDALLKVSTSTDTPLAYWEELTSIQGKYLKLLISDNYKDRITDFLTEVKALKEKHDTPK